MIIVPSGSEVLHKNEILFVASYLAAVLLFRIGLICLESIMRGRFPR